MLKKINSILLLTLTAPLLSGAFGAKKHNTKPNVVIMIADDISYNDFGCYGHPTLKTPNIDNLAKGGIRFTNAFLTASSCSPSRCSIITGRYPHNTGAAELHSPLPDKSIVFPQLLKDNGYYTAHAGKWHLGSSSMTPKGVAVNAFDVCGGSAYDGGGPSGSERWVERLKKRPTDKPFFMWFAAHDAHRGWDNKINGERYSEKDVLLPPYVVDNLKTRKDFAKYYNEVTRFDDYVGKVVKELKSQGVFENTMIIVMADNGRPFPRDKTRLYDSGIKTPLVISFPNYMKKSGVVSESLVSTIDIASTILKAADIKSGKSFMGKSFLKLLNNPEKEINKYVYAEHNWHDYMAHERMVRSKEHLYIFNRLISVNNVGAIDVMRGAAGVSLKEGFKNNTLNKFQKQMFNIPQPKEEFYLCNEDKLQLNNRVNDPEFKNCVKKMRKALLKWQKKTNDIIPQKFTQDWYHRETCKPLPEKGVRGDMPGGK